MRGSEEQGMTEKKKKAALSCSVIVIIVMAGAMLTFSMYSLIQNNFFKTTVTHEMELMQIMETLGSQLLDSRLKDLKSDLESTAQQYSERLLSASAGQENTRKAIAQALSALTIPSSERYYCYQTAEKQYYSSQFQASDTLQIDLAQAWAGDTVVFSPDFNEKGAYVMAIATPVWENEHKNEVAGVLIEYVEIGRAHV